MKWIFIVSSASVFILSDFLAANWGKNNSSISLILLFFIPSIGYLFFGMLNKNENLSVSSAFVNIILLVGTILVGLIFMGDEISNRQVLGLILAIIAVVLLS